MTDTQDQEGCEWCSEVRALQLVPVEVEVWTTGEKSEIEYIDTWLCSYCADKYEEALAERNSRWSEAEC